MLLSGDSRRGGGRPPPPKGSVLLISLWTLGVYVQRIDLDKLSTRAKRFGVPEALTMASPIMHKGARGMLYTAAGSYFNGALPSGVRQFDADWQMSAFRYTPLSPMLLWLQLCLPTWTSSSMTSLLVHMSAGKRS